MIVVENVCIEKIIGGGQILRYTIAIIKSSG